MSGGPLQTGVRLYLFEIKWSFKIIDWQIKAIMNIFRFDIDLKN